MKLKIILFLIIANFCFAGSTDKFYARTELVKSNNAPSLIFKIRQKLILSGTVQLHLHGQIKITKNTVKNVMDSELSQIPYALRIQLQYYF